MANAVFVGKKISFFGERGARKTRGELQLVRILSSYNLGIDTKPNTQSQNPQQVERKAVNASTRNRAQRRFRFNTSTKSKQLRRLLYPKHASLASLLTTNVGVFCRDIGGFALVLANRRN